MFAIAVRLIPGITFKISEAGLFWWDGDIEGRVKEGWKAGRRPKGGNKSEGGTLKPNRAKDLWARLNFFKICHRANRYSMIFGYCDTEVIEDDCGGVLESIHWRNMKKSWKSEKPLDFLSTTSRRGSHRRIQLRRWTHGGKLLIQRLGRGKLRGVELIYYLGYLGRWGTRCLYT